MSLESRDLVALHDTFARRLWRVVVRLGVPESSAEDVVQDIFLTAFKERARFEGRSSPATWLYGIALRLAANTRRSRKPSAALSLVEPDTAPLADQELDRRRKLAELQRVLNQLPEEQREAVVLMDLEQLSAPEAAEILEVKVNTLYSRLRLGRAALKGALSTEVKA
ncbi:MAG: RNA polymerase sigma factor [Myxococcaceae bacterium]